MQFQINAGHMSTNKLIYSKIIYAANKVRVALRSTGKNYVLCFWVIIVKYWKFNVLYDYLILLNSISQCHVKVLLEKV